MWLDSKGTQRIAQILTPKSGKVNKSETSGGSASISQNTKISTLVFFGVRKSDILIGGLESNIAIKLFKPTKPYIRNELTWCVKSAEQYPAWLNFFTVINDIRFIIAASSTFYAVVILLYALSITEGTYIDFHVAKLITFAILLNVPTYYRPKRRIIQVIFLVAVFSSLWLNTTIFSFYTYLTTVPKYKMQIDTLKEIVDEDFRFVGEASTLAILQEGKMVRSYYGFWLIKESKTIPITVYL